MKEPSRFLPFFPIFPLFFRFFLIFPFFFPIFGNFFAVRGGTLPPLHPQWLRYCVYGRAYREMCLGLIRMHDYKCRRLLEDAENDLNPDALPHYWLQIYVLVDKNMVSCLLHSRIMMITCIDKQARKGIQNVM